MSVHDSRHPLKAACPLALVAALALIPLARLSAAVDEVPPAPTPAPAWYDLGAQEDNDFFYISPHKSDGLYTQGLRIYGRYHESMPAPRDRDELQKLMASVGGGWWHDSPTNAYASGLALGQELYTPTSIVSNGSPGSPSNGGNGNQPYVGWSYGALTGEIGGAQSHDRLEMDIGAVGPPSEGSETQTYFHRLIHNTEPSGWSQQVHGEPGLDLLYRHDEWLPGTLTANHVVISDADIHLTVVAGNIHTQAEVGIQWRLGWNLGHAGGPQGDPGEGMAYAGWRRFSFGTTFEYDERFVARNIFLDGNTFRDSDHVTKRPFVSDFAYGLVAGYAFTQDFRFDAAYIETIQSREFYGADHDDRYASLIAAFTWVP